MFIYLQHNILFTIISEKKIKEAYFEISLKPSSSKKHKISNDNSF